ncbi:MAG: hypothetical protein MJ252_00030 [archaeon]|nr:hypothetical protein [archaeon]
MILINLYYNSGRGGKKWEDQKYLKNIAILINLLVTGSKGVLAFFIQKSNPVRMN